MQVRAAEHEASATADRTGEAARKLDGEAAQVCPCFIKYTNRTHRSVHGSAQDVGTCCCGCAFRQATVTRHHACLLAPTRSMSLHSSTSGRSKFCNPGPPGINCVTLHTSSAPCYNARQGSMDRRSASTEPCTSRAISPVCPPPQLRQRSLQLEALLKARDRELERAHRATEAAQQAAADAGTAAAEAQAAARRLEGEAAALRQRLVVVEGTVRARERDLEKAEKALEQVGPYHFCNDSSWEPTVKTAVCRSGAV